jgi:hypothetical protein
MGGKTEKSGIHEQESRRFEPQFHVSGWMNRRPPACESLLVNYGGITSNHVNDGWCCMSQNRPTAQRRKKKTGGEL